jgi:hypothetical protein
MLLEVKNMSELEQRVKALEDQWQRLQQVFIAAPTPTLQPKKEPASILARFNPEQASRLDAIQENGVWKISPKHFLPPPIFGEISEVVKGLGGKYVPATPNVPGHWTAPL